MRSSERLTRADPCLDSSSLIRGEARGEPPSSATRLLALPLLLARVLSRFANEMADIDGRDPPLPPLPFLHEGDGAFACESLFHRRSFVIRAVRSARSRLTRSQYVSARADSRAICPSSVWLASAPDWCSPLRLVPPAPSDESESPKLSYWETTRTAASSEVPMAVSRSTLPFLTKWMASRT